MGMGIFVTKNAKGGKSRLILLLVTVIYTDRH